MNRQFKRIQAREERRASTTEDVRRDERMDVARSRKRTPPREYFREIRAELKKVAWPTRREVVSYTVVVIASTTVLTALVFGMDFVFQKLVIGLFG